jgi:hypothetical protein
MPETSGKRLIKTIGKEIYIDKVEEWNPIWLLSAGCWLYNSICKTVVKKWSVWR